jgi:rhodanese-related sulfurtransferase
LCIVTAGSAQAARLLQERGFADVFILEVGIDARSEQIDPRVPTY